MGVRQPCWMSNIEIPCAVGIHQRNNVFILAWDNGDRTFFAHAGVTAGNEQIVIVTHQSLGREVIENEARIISARRFGWWRRERFCLDNAQGDSEYNPLCFAAPVR